MGAGLRCHGAAFDSRRFHVTAEEILEVLASPDVEVDPPADVMLPDHLVPPERLAADLQVRS